MFSGAFCVVGAFGPGSDESAWRLTGRSIIYSLWSEHNSDVTSLYDATEELPEEIRTWRSWQFWVGPGR